MKNVIKFIKARPEGLEPQPLISQVLSIDYERKIQLMFEIFF